MLLLAAVVAPGGLGVLFAIFALLAVVDAVVPMPGGSWSAAEDAFWRLEHQRRHAAWRRRVRGRAPDRLEVLDDQAGPLLAAARRDRGVEAVAIASITATVEDAKARTFDARFRPDRSERGRWQAIWMAQSHGTALPPIAVYRVGDRHVVRDGHHRVSVARERGATTIEAEVVELRLRDPGARGARVPAAPAG